MKSLTYRNERLKLHRLSLRADLLKERCQGTGINFRYLMQTDFILFMRAELYPEVLFPRWWPETLMYLGHFLGPFEIFARAESKQYFEKMKCLFGIQNPQDFKQLLEEYKQGKRELPRWQFESFNPALLLNIEKLATRS